MHRLNLIPGKTPLPVTVRLAGKIHTMLAGQAKHILHREDDQIRY